MVQATVLKQATSKEQVNHLKYDDKLRLPAEDESLVKERVLQLEDESLRKSFLDEGIGHMFFGPTAAESVDASLSGRALSWVDAKAKAAPMVGATHCPPRGEQAKKTRG